MQIVSTLCDVTNICLNLIYVNFVPSFYINLNIGSILKFWDPIGSVEFTKLSSYDNISNNTRKDKIYDNKYLDIRKN